MDYQNNRPAEPLLPHDIPDRPWAKVGIDLFELAHHDYLVIVDYYSKFPEIIPLPDKTTHSVITGCKSVFLR
jgi:hypothetical protein